MALDLNTVVNRPQLFKHIVEDEGLLLQPKPDMVYNPTTGQSEQKGFVIGFGRNYTNPNQHQSITREDAINMYKEDIVKAASIANRFIGEDVFSQLPENKQNVLINMAYQMGNNITGFTDMRDNIRSGKWIDATYEMANSLQFKQTPNRVKRNIDRFIGGTMPDNDKQTYRESLFKKYGTRQDGVKVASENVRRSINTAATGDVGSALKGFLQNYQTTYNTLGEMIGDSDFEPDTKLVDLISDANQQSFLSALAMSDIAALGLVKGDPAASQMIMADEEQANKLQFIQNKLAQNVHILNTAKLGSPEYKAAKSSIFNNIDPRRIETLLKGQTALQYAVTPLLGGLQLMSQARASRQPMNYLNPKLSEYALDFTMNFPKFAERVEKGLGPDATEKEIQEALSPYTRSLQGASTILEQTFNPRVQ